MTSVFCSPTPPWLLPKLPFLLSLTVNADVLEQQLQQPWRRGLGQLVLRHKGCRQIAHPVASPHCNPAHVATTPKPHIQVKQHGSAR